MEIIFFLAPCFLLIWALLVWRDAARNARDNGEPSRLIAFQFDSLFAEQHVEDSRQLAIADARLRDQNHRQRLLNLASEGEESVLEEASKYDDSEFYAEVLKALTAQANSPERLRSIANYIVDSQELRSSREFAETMMELWRLPVTQRSLADMLYLSALADDADVFTRAIYAALELWQLDLRTKVTTKDFMATVESAYWLVSGEVRYSGAGFLLKQAIADVRRELATATRQMA